ncbi:MAG: ferrochelatase [Armatimonadetes bacterium]|nr:ferrochelatase [Armatimonadota bacterium]
MNSKPIGLLVMHYGTPASMEDVEAYYTHIRRGRPPEKEDLEDLISRYQAIGGPSPLTATSEQQAQLILEGLKKRGIDARLYIGAKHAPPFVGDAVRQMAADGIDEAVGLVLAPQYSSFSIAAYRKAALAAVEESRPQMQIYFLERWGELPAYIEALAGHVKESVKDWNLDETLVIFSAHSLPRRIMAEGDPYVKELMATSRLVADAAAVPNWRFAFQSASKTGEPWLGPDILDVIDEEKDKYKNVLACTVGFVSDHLEVLYDLGIETRDHCEQVGIKNYRRASTIGADPKVMDALAEQCMGLIKAPTSA